MISACCVLNQDIHPGFTVRFRTRLSVMERVSAYKTPFSGFLRHGTELENASPISKH